MPPPPTDPRAISNLYSAYAQRTNRIDFPLYESYGRQFLTIFEHLSKQHGSERSRVLDVGCSTGSLAAVMREKGYSVIGLDIDVDALRIAKERYHLELWEGTVDDVVERGEVFDIVLFNHVLEHIHQPLEMLGKMKKILRPRGMVWVALPNLDSFRFYVQRGATPFLQPSQHVWHFNRGSLTRLLLASGFDNLALTNYRLRHYKNWVRVGWRGRQLKKSVVDLGKAWKYNAIEICSDIAYSVSRSLGDGLAAVGIKAGSD